MMNRSSQNKGFIGNYQLNLAGKLRQLNRPWIMGILNINPNSFYDGGQYTSVESAVAQCRKMQSQGADIIDIGAASTKPGSSLISPEEEWKILKPIIAALTAEGGEAFFSVDTYNSQVAEQAAKAGAHMINDISGGTFDEKMPEVMGDLKLPYVMMHIQGTPENMQKNPQYADVFKEVAYFFSKQMDAFLAQGVNDIILDPGFGFGKTVDHNYTLLSKLDLFKEIFERPILAGISRKSMINKVLETKPENALTGTTALNVMAIQKGADFLRVHDVQEAVEVAKITTFTQKFS